MKTTMVAIAAIVTIVTTGDRTMNWFRNRKAKLIRKAEEDGYNWAAGNLLKGQSVEYVSSFVFAAKSFSDYGPFDSGVDRAVKDFENLISNSMTHCNRGHK